MLGSIATLVLILTYSPPACAQSTEVPDHKALMDNMIGEWVMAGMIAGEQVTHDVFAEWILHRRYVRIHEVSREKDEDGELAYEAWIHIAWDAENDEYVIMWLDSTETTNFAAEGVGHGQLEGDRIPFVWSLANGSGIRNTFSYNREGDTWSWTIDNVDESGSLVPFARLLLEPK